MTGPVGAASGKGQAAFFTVFGIFFLTLLLAGQAVGTMAEERSNKVIEVLAAAVPLESVFLGKLLGMFGVAVLFVAFWGTVVGNLGLLLPPDIQEGDWIEVGMMGAYSSATRTGFNGFSAHSMVQIPGLPG